MLAEELYNDTASFIVAEGEDGGVLGYAGLHVILDEGYIDNVAVRPDCRRQGEYQNHHHLFHHDQWRFAFHVHVPFLYAWFAFYCEHGSKRILARSLQLLRSSSQSSEVRLPGASSWAVSTWTPSMPWSRESFSSWASMIRSPSSGEKLSPARQ